MAGLTKHMRAKCTLFVSVATTKYPQAAVVRDLITQLDVVIGVYVSMWDLVSGQDRLALS